MDTSKDMSAAFDKLPILSDIIATAALLEKLREEFLAVLDFDRAESNVSASKDALKSSIQNLAKSRRGASREDLQSYEQHRAMAEKIVVDSEKLLQGASQNLRDLAPEVSSMVKKHYRVSSVSVHPDRQGEQSRERFELLKRAASILDEPDLRRKYYRDHISVITRLPALLVYSHELWMQRHAPAAANFKRPSRAPAWASDMNRITEGGGNQLRSPSLLAWGVRGTSDEHIATIKVMWAGGQTVQTVQFQVFNWENPDSGWEDQKSRDGHILQKTGEMDACVNLRGFGHFQVRWRLEFCGSDYAYSQWSNPLELEHFDPQKLAQERAKHRAHQDLVWHKSKMRYALSYFERSFDLPSVGVGEQQQAAARLRNESKKCLVLITRYEGLSKHGSGSIDFSVVREMRLLQESADHLLRELDEVEALVTKKELQRRFKSEIITHLEGDAKAWLEDSTNLSAESLVEMGGTANRLFQILLQHRKSCLGSQVYFAAASREDLFTARQCAKLVALAEAQKKSLAEVEHGHRKAKNQIDTSDQKSEKTNRRYVRRSIKILADNRASLLSQREWIILACVSRAAQTVFNDLDISIEAAQLRLQENGDATGTTHTADTATHEGTNQKLNKSRWAFSRGQPANKDVTPAEQDVAGLPSSRTAASETMDPAALEIKDLQRQLQHAEMARMCAERAQREAVSELQALRKKFEYVVSELQRREAVSELQRDPQCSTSDIQIWNLARAISCDVAASPSPILETLEIGSLLFTQDSIAARFQDDRPVIGLVDDLLSGRVDSCRHANLVLDVVRFQGSYRCLNNRRLWALKEYEKRLNFGGCNGKEKSWKRVRVRVRVSNVCAMTAKFLLANTSENNGRATRMRSLSRAPRCASKEAKTRTNVTSYRQRSQSRQPPGSILKETDGEGSKPYQTRSLSRKPSVRISEDVDNAVGRISTGSNISPNTSVEGSHVRKLEWEVYSDPRTGKHWWWNATEQRATFTDPYAT